MNDFTGVVCVGVNVMCLSKCVYCFVGQNSSDVLCEMMEHISKVTRFRIYISRFGLFN